MEARALVDSVVGRADAAGLHSLAIEARQVAGSMAELAGDSSVAEVLLREAMVEAGAAALDDIAADAAIELTLVVGKSLGRHVEALRIGEVAEMFVRRIGQVDRPRHARLLAHMAWARHMSGELREALALEERAVEILRRELGETHPDLVLATDHLASLRRSRGSTRRR
ncbi:hypothetical protein [Nannocystis pusilla]|uniref:hypothetical protein n=1 Tax=Nannocystis pusilla TaxID=889268 RepID=UPI003B81AA6A